MFATVCADEPRNRLQSRRIKIERAFTAYTARNKDGLLPEQLGEFMRQEGYAPTQQQLRRYESEAAGGPIQLDYLVKCCEETGYDDPGAEELISFFSPFDPEDTGFIPTVVLRRILLTMGDALSPAEINAMFKEFGCSERLNEMRPLEDYVNYRNFVQWTLQR